MKFKDYDSKRLKSTLKLKKKNEYIIASPILVYDMTGLPVLLLIQSVLPRIQATQYTYSLNN